MPLVLAEGKTIKLWIPVFVGRFNLGFVDLCTFGVSQTFKGGIERKEQF
jgi:hypothetical protein